MNISIRKMRVFLAALEKRSFTKAAVAENISQPATTIIISQIEEEFQCELFVRRGSVRSAYPTPAGEEVADTFSRIIAHYDGELAGVRSISSGQRRKNRVLIQTSYDIFLNPAWLDTIVDKYLSNDLSVEVMPRADIIQQVAERDATIGLIDGGVDNESVDFAAIGDFKLVMAQPLTHKSEETSQETSISMDDMPEKLLAFTDFSPTLKRQISKKFASMDQNGTQLITMNSLSTLISQMERHGLPAIIPDALSGYLSPRVPCKIVPFKDVSFASQFGLITPWGNISRLPRAITRPQSCFQPLQISHSPDHIGAAH